MTRSQLYREWRCEGGRAFRPGRTRRAKRRKQLLEGRKVACEASTEGQGDYRVMKMERMLQEKEKPLAVVRLCSHMS